MRGLWAWWTCVMLAAAGVVAVTIGGVADQDGWAVAGVFALGIGMLGTVFTGKRRS